MGSTRDDLLTPTLEADLDVHAFERPWNPQSILWAGFFGGPLAGGLLHAWNDRRLKRGRQFPFTLLATLLVALLTSAVSGWLWTRAADYTTGRMWMRIGQRGVGVALCLVLTSLQQKRFRAYEMAGLERGKLFRTGLITVLVAGTLQSFLTVGVYLGLGGVIPEDDG